MPKGTKGFQNGHETSAETRKKIGDAHRRQVYYECDFCGKRASDKPSQFKLTKRHFCNMGCYSLYRSLIMPSEEQNRFGLGMPEHEKKARIKCRSDTNHAIRQGKISRKECRVCGEIAEAHHEDYSKPFEIDWMCMRHHRQYHTKSTDTPELLEKQT